MSCSTSKPTIEASPWAKKMLKELTLRQKIAQMMVYHMNLDYLPANSSQWQEVEKILASDGIGGLHVW